jgi:hypothetical protein
MTGFISGKIIAHRGIGEIGPFSSSTLKVYQTIIQDYFTIKYPSDIPLLTVSLIDSRGISV